MSTDFSPSEYQVTVTKCNNGFIVTLFDPYSNPVRTEVVHANAATGYGKDALTPIILAQYEYADEHLTANSLGAMTSTDAVGDPPEPLAAAITADPAIADGTPS